MFLISPELHLKLAYVDFVPLSFSHVDAAEEKGLVLLPKVRYYEDARSGEWMHL